MNTDRTRKTTYFKKDAVAQQLANMKYQLLLESVKEGNADEVAALLCQEPELSSNQLMCLLRNAVSKGNLQIVQLLLSPKLNLKFMSFSVKLLSPLWIAVFDEQYEIAKVLIKYGAPVNSRLGRHPAHDRLSTMLHIAAYLAGISNDYRMVDLLVKSGADVHAKDGAGCSILHYVTTMGNAELLEKMLSSNVKLGKDEALVLHAAAFRPNAEQLLRILVHHGANVFIRDANGYNLLHSLAKGLSTNVGAARFLIEQGVSLNDTDKHFHQTPLHLAVTKDKELMVELLLDHGANINAEGASGKTPLYVAAYYNRPAILRLLLTRGADIDKTTSNGKTALHGSCTSHLGYNIQVLLDFGANINAKDSSGKLPLSRIEFKNTNPAMVVMLKRLARMTFDGSHVDPLNLQIIEEYPKLQEYYTNCLQELGRMKIELFFNSSSLHAILSNTLYSLTLLTKNTDFVRAFESYDLAAFPLYASDLISNFSRAKDKREVLSSTEDFLSCLFSGYLPHTAIRRIVFFMYFV